MLLLTCQFLAMSHLAIICLSVFFFLMEVYTTDAVCCNGEHIAIKNIVNIRLLLSPVTISSVPVCGVFYVIAQTLQG